MTVKTRLSAMMAAMIILSAGTVNAEESAPTPEETPIDRAIWIDPVSSTAPWFDSRTADFSVSSAEVLAVGTKAALVRFADGKSYFTDAQLKKIGPAVFPEGTQRIFFDTSDRVIVYDGKQFLSAANITEAGKPDGFFKIFEQSDISTADLAGSTLVFASSGQLVMSNLETGTQRKISLNDFFDDEKCAAMTPEAIANSTKKKSRKRSNTAKSESAAETDLQIPTAEGIWWRSDGVGIIRLRRLLAQRTFVTRDGGQSWIQMENVPNTLVRIGDWIWNGIDLVLTQDASQFVRVSGIKLHIPDRLVPGHDAAISSALPSDWMHPTLPTAPPISDAAPSENQTSQDNQASQDSIQTDFIPVLTSSLDPQIAQAVHGIYQPQDRETGMKIGLYRNGSCPGGGRECAAGIQNPPDAWQIPAGGTLTDLPLPEGCIPIHAGSVHGLGILLCAADNHEALVYVRTAESDWKAETLLTSDFLQNTQILSAPDGSAAIVGTCYEEETAADPDFAPEETEVSAEPSKTISKVCNAAIRMPYAVSAEGAWRIERLVNAQTYALVNGGRLIVNTDIPGIHGQQMTMYTQTSSEVLADSLDSSKYKGITLTTEGCLALDEGTDQTKLLSISGGIAQADCQTSKALVTEAAEKAAAQAANTEDGTPVGDPRYGLRVGVNGFFASGVQTWAMRVEGLIPIYKGQYEVGLMYRMSGGNKGGALGHLGIASVRWRYDGLELFDFAVGAGIGYGSMCGYQKDEANTGSSESSGDSEETEPVTERKKGFAACNTLSMRYMISGIATYKLSKQWKIYLSAELLGGVDWGFDIGGGLEVRF